MLKEPEEKVRYWIQVLRQGNYLESPRKGLGFAFTDEQINLFKQIQAHLNNGAETAQDALKLIGSNITVDLALARHEALTNQLASAQSKLIQLRKPVWERIRFWFTTILRTVRKNKAQL